MVGLVFGAKEVLSPTCLKGPWIRYQPVVMGRSSECPLGTEELEEGHLSINILALRDLFVPAMVDFLTSRSCNLDSVEQ